MKQKRDNIILKLVLWLSVGIIGSMASTAMYISESFNLFSFYDVGMVYDIDQYVRQSAPTRSNAYISSSQSSVFEIISNGASKRVFINGEDIKWKYLDLEIGNLNKESMEWTVAYFDSENNQLHRELFLLYEGDNVLSLDSKAPFSYFDIIWSGDDVGLTFSLERMQLREEVPLFQMGRFVKLTLFFFGIYMVFTLICYYLLKNKTSIKIKPSILIDKLQKMYSKAGDYLYIHTKKIKSPVRRFIRTLLFLILIVYMIVTLNYKHQVILWDSAQKLYIICMLGIAIVSIEDKLRPVNWNNNLVYSWSIFWILACISDFVVTKIFSFVGYVQLVVFGFLFFCWNNMKHPKEILREFIDAWNILFYVVLVINTLFYPVETGERYKGIFFNSNMLAIFLTIIVAISLAQLLNLFHKKDKTAIKRYFIIYMGKLGVAFYYIWKTQSRSALLTAIVLVLILFAVSFYFVKKHKKLKSAVVLFLLVSFCLIPLVKVNVQTEASELSNLMDSRVFQSLSSGSLERISSGRVLIWWAYIREMNLWGHEYRPIVGGSSRDAHNAFLSVAYRYGVFSIIPYICLWYFSLKNALRYLKSKKSYAFLPLSICLSFMFISSLDAEEQPYTKFLWFAMYFIIGILFPSEEAQNE